MKRLIPWVFVLFGCGSTSGTGGSGGGTDEGGTSGGGESLVGGGGSEPEPVTTVLHPEGVQPLPGEADCTVTIAENLPLEGQTHEPVCTTEAYQTSPPSSGNHWPIWLAYRTYDAPIPAEMLVHNLEHGAIVAQHECADCPEVLPFLEAERDVLGVDSLCVAGGGTSQSRFVIAPGEALAAPISISAWRATYTATCLDSDSLRGFFTAHYGKGTEATCAEGKDPYDPTTGIAECFP